jgi:hypothetical protein
MPPKKAVPPKKATLPPNFQDSVEDTAMLTNDLIKRTASTLGDIAKRWMDGMSRTDVDAITKNVGTNVNQFWLKVYDTAEDNVTPPPTGTGTL